MRKSWLLFAGLVMLVGCVTTRSVQLGEYEERAPVPWQKVAVYRTADDVPGPYEEIALLTAKGDSVVTGQASMASFLSCLGMGNLSSSQVAETKWKKLQKKAGKVGANAIIIEAHKEPKDGAKIASTLLLGFGPSRQGKAVAIYILPPEKK